MRTYNYYIEEQEDGTWDLKESNKSDFCLNFNYPKEAEDWIRNKHHTPIGEGSWEYGVYEGITVGEMSFETDYDKRFIEWAI